MHEDELDTNAFMMMVKGNASFIAFLKSKGNLKIPLKDHLIFVQSPQK